MVAAWIQIIAVFYVQYVPPFPNDNFFFCMPKVSQNLKKYNRYVSCTLTIIYFIVIPVIVMAHWLIASDTTWAMDNGMRAWCAYYPFVGMTTIIAFVWKVYGMIIVTDTMNRLQGKGTKKDKFQQLIEKII